MPRLQLVLASCLWSLSGGLAKIIVLPGPSMAAYRALFAGLFLSAFVRREHIRWRPALVGMVVCFAALNLCFVWALTLTSSANAIFLQCTAPVWTLLICVFWLGEPLDRRSLVSVVIGLGGMAIIAGGGWREAPLGIALALASGVFYALATVFLRHLRHENPLWLTALNLLFGGLLILPLTFLPGQVSPFQLSGGTALAMVGFGVVQMGIPYVLYSSALRHISPQEAGVITLLEPILNPFVAYLFVGELPAVTTFVGGGIVLAAVALRYFPIKKKSRSTEPVAFG